MVPSFELIIWIMFCIVFGCTLILAFIMRILSKFFYTNDTVIRKFNILDLEIAASPKELVSLIRGLYKLPGNYSHKAVRALKTRLYLDFIFMPFAYGSIILLCYRVSEKMEHDIGKVPFVVFACLQMISWLCDIIENIYLLRKIHPNPVESSQFVHTMYLRMEAVKWGIIFIGVVSSLAAVAYYWLSGQYAVDSLYTFLIILVEIIFFIVLGFFIKPKPPVVDDVGVK